MPKAMKTCRVCGSSYEACHSIRTGSATFNWREVACSPECGMKYFERIMASRSAIVDPAPVEEITEEVVESALVDKAEYFDDFDDVEDDEEDIDE